LTTTEHSAGRSGSGSFMDRNYFLLRRLHSLTGIVPIGVFLINHLLTNSSVLWGSFAIKENVEGGWREGGIAYFWKEVKWINEQIPHLLLIEMALWGAIAFHSILGVYYALQGKSNTNRYAYQSNWRYTLQRVSGYIGIFFILYHVGTLRWGWTFLVPGGTQWSHHYASSTLAAALRGGMEGITVAGFLVSLFYLVSVSLLVFHFANGLWTAAITWGLTVSKQAQQRWGYACLGLGAAMMLMGWGSVIGYASLNPTEVKRLEESLAGNKHTAAMVDQAPSPAVDPSR
jgi:succinate dehydrogenase / fumarate reductase cytochrome b subunit